LAIIFGLWQKGLKVPLGGTGTFSDDSDRGNYFFILYFVEKTLLSKIYLYRIFLLTSRILKFKKKKCVALRLIKFAMIKNIQYVNQLFSFTPNFQFFLTKIDYFTGEKTSDLLLVTGIRPIPVVAQIVVRVSGFRTRLNFHGRGLQGKKLVYPGQTGQSRQDGIVRLVRWLGKLGNSW